MFRYRSTSFLIGRKRGIRYLTPLALVDGPSQAAASAPSAPSLDATRCQGHRRRMEASEWWGEITTAPVVRLTVGRVRRIRPFGEIVYILSFGEQFLVVRQSVFCWRGEWRGGGDNEDAPCRLVIVLAFLVVSCPARPWVWITG